jgi:hypothetical protein
MQAQTITSSVLARSLIVGISLFVQLPAHSGDVNSLALQNICMNELGTIPAPETKKACLALISAQRSMNSNAPMGTAPKEKDVGVESFGSEPNVNDGFAALPFAINAAIDDAACKWHGRKVLLPVPDVVLWVATASEGCEGPRNAFPMSLIVGGQGARAREVFGVGGLNEMSIDKRMWHKGLPDVSAARAENCCGAWNWRYAYDGSKYVETSSSYALNFDRGNDIDRSSEIYRIGNDFWQSASELQNNFGIKSRAGCTLGESDLGDANLKRLGPVLLWLTCDDDSGEVWVIQSKSSGGIAPHMLLHETVSFAGDSKAENYYDLTYEWSNPTAVADLKFGAAKGGATLWHFIGDSYARTRETSTGNGGRRATGETH